MKVLSHPISSHEGLIPSHPIPQRSGPIPSHPRPNPIPSRSHAGMGRDQDGISWSWRSAYKLNLNDSDIDLQKLADEQLHHEIENTSSSNMLSSENTMSTSESTDSHLLMLSTLEKMPESIFSVLKNEKKISTRLII